MLLPGWEASTSRTRHPLAGPNLAPLNSQPPCLGVPWSGLSALASIASSLCQHTSCLAPRPFLPPQTPAGSLPHSCQVPLLHEDICHFYTRLLLPALLSVTWAT